MIRHDEHTGCKITLKMDDKETIWQTEQWDCDATQLIQAFAGLMISQTFLPTTVWSCMKEEAEDQMRFLKTDELESKIESLEIEREFLEESVKKQEEEIQFLKDQIFNYENSKYAPDCEAPCEESYKIKKESPIQMSEEESLVRAVPYVDPYKGSVGIPDVETEYVREEDFPEEECVPNTEHKEESTEYLEDPVLPLY